MIRRTFSKLCRIVVGLGVAGASLFTVLLVDGCDGDLQVLVEQWPDGSTEATPINLP